MTRAIADRDVSCEPECDIEALAAEGQEDMRRRYPRVRVYLMRITREVAEAMLDRNTHNRKVRESHVTALQQSFEARDIVLNGETIIFSWDGVLLDGQHRLIACRDSGIAFDAVVVFGISPKAFDTLDGGEKRSTGDVLGMSSHANANNLASAVQALVAFVDNGGMFLSGSCSTQQVRKATPTLAARVLKAHPGLVDSVATMKNSRLMRTQHGVALHYVFSLVDRGLAHDFADVLANGSSDTARPFCRLRESLISTPLTTGNRGTYAAKAVIAFNAERAGLRPKILRVGSEWPLVDGLDLHRLARSIS